MPTPTYTQRVYRLRGSLDGRETHVFLSDGEYQVGSSRRADVFLPVPGVSRRHARIVIDDRGMRVEDLDSTNGTRVDGQRVERADVASGARLRFGPVKLQVEEVAAADAELAISLESEPAVEGAELSLASTLVVGDESVPQSAGAAFAELPELVFPEGYCAGRSPATRTLYAQLRPLLKGDLPVLISGETGVGKEFVARILHASSDRRDGPLVAVNCAAIPAELLEAEMFGIGRGVATGVEAREGKFQIASGGTLFLDEIGEMTPVLQAKLLRALQEKEVHPVGGRPQRVDVRVVSATNVNLERHMDQGTLRRDLYYRLAGFVLEVPALRHAREDIPGLVEHFLRVTTAVNRVRVRGLTVGALARLESYHWPGNIRELEHEVRRLVLLSSSGGVITSDHLSSRIQGPNASPEKMTRLVDELESLDLAPLVARLEEALIREALRRAEGKKIDACRLLGLSRNGLDKKLKRLGISA